MANYQQERLGIYAEIAIAAIQAGKAGLDYYKSKEDTEREKIIADSGLATMNALSQNQTIAGLTQSNQQSKINSYIAIGAAALVGLIALTR